MESPPLHTGPEWFQTVLASIGDAVIATDRQSRVVFLNPVAAELTGWPEAEALGQDITVVFRIVNEVTRQSVENPITRVLREGTVVGLANQTLLLSRDGVERPIDDSAAPIYDAQGQLLGVVLVFRDVTERQRAEEARTHLAAIVESSDDAIIGKTLEGIITSWNQAAERLYGYTAAEMIGQPIARLIPPDLADDLPMIMRRLRQGERIEHYETQRLAKDGTRIDVALTISPLRDRTGQIIGASKIARDITERRRAEAVRTHLAAIVESADDAIIGKTLEGIITSWNRAAERLYGYTAAEMIGQPIVRLIPSDLADDFPMIMRRLRRGERIEHHETQRLAKDGTRIEVALTISPLRDRTGQIIGASKIARDITARKQAEAELARRRQEMALLTDIAQELSASLELETVLQRIVTGAQELCGSERVLLALREPGTDTLSGRYEVGPPPMAYTGLRIAPGQGLGGQVLRTGRPWRTADYATDPRFSKALSGRGTRRGAPRCSRRADPDGGAGGGAALRLQPRQPSLHRPGRSHPGAAGRPRGRGPPECPALSADAGRTGHPPNSRSRARAGGGGARAARGGPHGRPPAGNGGTPAPGAGGATPPALCPARPLGSRGVA